ncbi:MAG: DUF3570 domain-containing protein [Polyangiaceae bacterium]|nr:DUF3570 domain-containing protein [Polyangiaceae bacterium]
MTRSSRLQSSRAVLSWVSAGLAVLLLGLPQLASAQIAEVDLRSGVFHEPSAQSHMTVLTPSATITAAPASAVSVTGSYQADIVSGASESVKAGPQLSSFPDIVSAASVTDFRHVASGAVDIQRRHTKLGLQYAYGTELDYKSQSFVVSAGTDFLQRNTEMEISYAKGFDKVCNMAHADGAPPMYRARLDSSVGCFTEADDRSEDDIDMDTFQGVWTQSWTPILTTQLIASASLLHGFLGNPYRGVVVGPSGIAAQEHHPTDRSRLALSMKTKLYIRSLKTATTLSFRGYRDSWEILSHTVGLDMDRHLSSWLRLNAHARYYAQTGAHFWSDDYTGGEPLNGPRGQYWSGDRELSPLKTYSGGTRFVAEWRGRSGGRLLGMFLNFSTSLSADLVKTDLENFTWAGTKPDDTLAGVASFSLTTLF